jgi:histidinol-phosphate phosphatase family protein
MIKSAVILAGGKGIRMLPITEFNPKALIPINGTPIIKKQIDQLVSLGVRQIIVLVGYLGYQIHDYLRSMKFDIEIDVIETDPNFTPAQRLIDASHRIASEFILIYCDNYIPDNHVIKAQLDSTADLKFVLQKRSQGNVKVRKGQEAIYVNHERSENCPFVELGYLAIRSPEFLNLLAELKDLPKTLATFSSKNICLFSELISEYNSVSSFKRYVEQKLFGNLVILDRDGVINKRKGYRDYVLHKNDLVLELENIAHLSIIGLQGSSFVVATNQPAIALGKMTERSLRDIHLELTNSLRLQNIHLLSFYTCKHHWNDNCECRKPKPGLLKDILKDFELTDKEVYFIGDSDSDMSAAVSASVRGFKIPENRISNFPI